MLGKKERRLRDMASKGEGEDDERMRFEEEEEEEEEERGRSREKERLWRRRIMEEEETMGGV